MPFAIIDITFIYSPSRDTILALDDSAVKPPAMKKKRPPEVSERFVVLEFECVILMGYLVSTMILRNQFQNRRGRSVRLRKGWYFYICSVFHNNHLYTLEFIPSPVTDFTQDIPKKKSRMTRKAMTKSKFSVRKSTKLQESHMSGQVSEEDPNQNPKFVPDFSVDNCHRY